MWLCNLRFASTLLGSPPITAPMPGAQAPPSSRTFWRRVPACAQLPHLIAVRRAPHHSKAPSSEIKVWNDLDSKTTAVRSSILGVQGLYKFSFQMQNKMFLSTCAWLLCKCCPIFIPPGFVPKGIRLLSPSCLYEYGRARCSYEYADTTRELRPISTTWQTLIIASMPLTRQRAHEQSCSMSKFVASPTRTESQLT